MANNFQIPNKHNPTTNFTFQELTGQAVSTEAAASLTSRTGLVVYGLQAVSGEQTSPVTANKSYAIGKAVEVQQAVGVGSLLGLVQEITQPTTTSAAFGALFRFAWVVSLPVQQDIRASTYLHRFFVTQQIGHEQTHTLPISQDVIGKVNTYTLPITQAVNEVYAQKLNITQSVVEVLNADGSVNADPYDDTFPEGGYVGVMFTPADFSGSWAISLFVEDTDISAALTGAVTVNKEENQAQTATLSLFDINLTDSIIDKARHNSITLNLIHKEPDGTVITTYRLFKGKLVSYTFDASSQVFSFTATDNLQEVVQDMYDREVLVPPVGQSFKTIEKPKGADGWKWLQEAMETVPVSYGLNADGVFQYYAWDNPTGAGMQFSDTNILDNTLSVALQDHKSLVNYVDITLHEKSQSVAEANDARFYQNNNHTHRAIVFCQQSLDAYGLQREVVSQTETADYTNSLEGWTKKQGDTYLTTQQISDLIIGATSGDFVFNGTCPTEEIPGQGDPYKLKVQAFYKTLSSSLGPIKYDLIPAPQDFIDKWGVYYTGYTISTVVSGPGQFIAGTGGFIYTKDADEVALCRNHADTLVVKNDLIAAAKKRIAETHRQTQVSFSSLAIPTMTWGSGASVATSHVKAEGRVSSITHNFNFTTGEATSDITMKILHGGKLLAPYQTNSFGVNKPPVNVNCSVDGGFDKVVYAETFKMTFEDATVELPTDNIDIGNY